MDITERKFLIEQIKRETLGSLKQYQVGWCHNGEMLATKNSKDWQGFIFIIPDDKYKELGLGV